jgi:hypothetical protein
VLIGIDLAGVKKLVDFDHLRGQFAHGIAADAVGQDERVEFGADFGGSQVVVSAESLVDAEADKSIGCLIGNGAEENLFGVVAGALDADFVRLLAGKTNGERCGADGIAIYRHRGACGGGGDLDSLPRTFRYGGAAGSDEGGHEAQGEELGEFLHNAVQTVYGLIHDGYSRLN